MKTKPEPTIDLTYDLLGQPRSAFLQRIFAQTRSRAKRWRIPFTLEPDHAEKLFQGQEGRCAVTGIAFNLEQFPEAPVKHPFAPSIDRKLSKDGYTPDNVRLVCVGMNFGMGQLGQELYMRLARAAVARENEEQGGRQLDRSKAEPSIKTRRHRKAVGGVEPSGL